MLTRNMDLLLVDETALRHLSIYERKTVARIIVFVEGLLYEFYFFVHRLLVNILVHWDCTVIWAAVGLNIFLSESLATISMNSFK